MRPHLLPFFALAFSLTTLHAEKPFSFSDTPGKLPKQVVPHEYAIRIAPDLEKLTFAGSETVKLEVREPVQKIVFNALEMQVLSAVVDGVVLDRSAIQPNEKEQTVSVVLKKELTAGKHTLALEFSGKINQSGQGLFYARYQEQGSGAKKTLLGTQFEATDARRMFPCWDEPSFRARFQLTAVVPENFVAVSNMPIEGENKTEGGKEVRFGLTPAMSSYLNVLVAGEFDSIEGESNGVKIRVITTKGKAETGRYALESAAKILQYYNDYFGVAYPLPKLDLIALPGGFGGAMENWGGITYFESVLLFDPQNSSAETQQNVFAVIAHEMAHQWFGDLVTMAWWDNLWLNEGFASWMGSRCTAHFNPQWEVWLRSNQPRDPSRRGGIAKEQAMGGDARSTTHPIQQPIATEAEANSAFDDITYKKGQSFIRMMESFLGEEVFRDGIRKYMTAHQFSNSTTADLWNALGEASGKPVGEIAAAWTQQPGFPLVQVTRSGDKLALTQERFTTHFPKAPALQWAIPLTFHAPNEQPGSLLMDGKSAEIPNIAATKPVKLNVDGAGNYRVGYDDVSWKLIVEELPTLSVPDRVNLLSDAWAMFEADRAPLARYTELVRKLTPTADLATGEQIINTFGFVNRLLSSGTERESFQKYARGILRPMFDTLGWEPKTGELATASALRVSLLAALGSLNDPDVITGARERFAKFRDEPASLHPDLRSAVLAIVGQAADEATWNTLHELGLKTTSTEEKQNYYSALAPVQNLKLAERTLQISLTDELPTSRAVHLVPRVARDGDHAELAWKFAKAHMKELLAKSDALETNRFAPGLFAFFSDASRIPELESYAKENLPPASRKAVEEATDEIGFKADLKKRLLAQMSSAFAESAR